MVGQVKVVGILMIIHGITVILMGGVYVALGIFAAAMPGGGGGAGGGGPPPLFLTLFYGIWGLVIIVSGVLNSIAGYRLLYFRGRVFAIVALFCNVLALLSCYCALTAIGMMIYGLIVLFHSDVAYAFEMVAKGASPEDVVGRYTRRYNDVRDDYDEEYRPRQGWEEERRSRDDEPDREDDDFRPSG